MVQEACMHAHTHNGACTNAIQRISVLVHCGGIHPNDNGYVMSHDVMRQAAGWRALG